MDWTEIDLATRAVGSCRICGGSGIDRQKAEPEPCGCALRNVFRICYERFQVCAMNRDRITRVSYERAPGGRSYRGTWSRKEEEYIADFEILARRTLDKAHYRIFRHHFLLGADWKLCSRRLGISRGNFFHAIYRIEKWLGKAFCETQPYALYPPRDYFAFRATDPVRACEPPRRREPIVFRTRRTLQSESPRGVEPASA